MHGVEIRRIALANAKSKTLQGGTRHDTRRMSLRTVATVLGIKSASTISKWKKQDQDEDSLQTRLSTRGVKRKLAEEDEKKVLQWVKRRRTAKKPVKIGMVRARVAAQTGGRVSWSASKVSRFMHEHGFSSQRARPASADTITAQYSKSVADFRAQVQSLRVPAKRRLVMDEAGIYDCDIHPYSYEAVGAGGAGVATPPTGTRDTIVACVRGDGSKLPLMWIAHSRANKAKNQPAVKGMSEKLMLQWVHAYLAPNVGDAEILQMDRLGAHATHSVLHEINLLGLQVAFSPAKAAKDVSPLDNSIFHDMKSHYRSLPHNTPASCPAGIRHGINAIHPQLLPPLRPDSAVP